jgi:V8-like Glu-specific endopeptidase
MAGVMMGLGVGGAQASESQVASHGDNTSYTQSSQERQGSGLDFRNARPMPLPMVDTAPMAAVEAVQRLGTPGFEAGARGTGETTRATGSAAVEASLIAAAAAEAEADGEVETQEYGTQNHPFTTSRVDLSTNIPSKFYPYRASGKLYFKKGTTTFVCSASLIKKGIIVTAAHCVANFGASQFYSGFQFIPALSGTLKPYGTWNVDTAWVKTSYFNGTDNCSTAGVVCENDVAILVARPKAKVYPGTKTGWLGYGWNGYGFAPGDIALINQLGYPVSHDAGLKMQRTDSQGFVSGFVGNTVWGSRQTGGSSGGPEVVNLGVAAALGGGVLLGADASFNIIVGVTSWGYTNQALKQQGASAFTSNNIVSLVNSACAAKPAAC